MLKPGELWYRKGEEKTYFVLDIGMAEVLPDRVTVLVRLADKPEDIDVVKQEADRRAAEGELQKRRDRRGRRAGAGRDADRDDEAARRRAREDEEGDRRRPPSRVPQSP